MARKKAKADSNVVWQGSEDLRPLLRPITELVADPENARFHGEENLEDLRRSLAKFGQQKAVVSNGDDVIHAGSGLFFAAMRLDWTHLAVTQSNLSEDDLDDYAIADNKTAESSRWNPDQLALRLEKIRQKQETQLEDVGFTEAEFNAIVKQLGDRHIRENGEASDNSSGEGSGSGPRRFKGKIIINCESQDHLDRITDELDSMGVNYRVL